MRNSDPMIVRLEPRQASWSDTDMRFSELIGKELIEGREDLLSEDYYRDWLAQGGGVPRPDQCIGYKVRYFLAARTTCRTSRWPS